MCSTDAIVGTERKTRNHARCNRFDVMGVLVNLDDKTAHKQTVSLFVNGVRQCKPVTLPVYPNALLSENKTISQTAYGNR